MALCHSFWYLLVLTIIPKVQSNIHSSFTNRQGPSSCILIASSLSKRRTSMGCRAVDLTRACLTASQRTNNWAVPHPCWATPHPTELRRTSLSYATPRWATPHPWERYTLFQNDHYFVSTINRYLSVQLQCTVVWQSYGFGNRKWAFPLTTS